MNGVKWFFFAGVNFYGISFNNYKELYFFCYGFRLSSVLMIFLGCVGLYLCWEFLGGWFLVCIGLYCGCGFGFC